MKFQRTVRGRCVRRHVPMPKARLLEPARVRQSDPRPFFFNSKRRSKQLTTDGTLRAQPGSPCRTGTGPNWWSEPPTGRTAKPCLLGVRNRERRLTDADCILRPPARCQLPNPKDRIALLTYCKQGHIWSDHAMEFSGHPRLRGRKGDVAGSELETWGFCRFFLQHLQICNGLTSLNKATIR